VMVQDRIERQAMELEASEEHFQLASQQIQVRSTVWKMVRKLRALELDLLTDAYQVLENQKATLLHSETVRRYLEGTIPAQPADKSGNEEDDFA